MLEIFDEFRERLDQVMLKAFGHRVVLWGYGYTGRFLAWYAEYYHSIQVDFIIEDNYGKGMPYEFPLFISSLFDFDYMGVKDAIVWLAIPEDEHIAKKLREHGYIEGETYYNFLDIVYGENYISDAKKEDDIFRQKKMGIRGIQFMEWLEYRYDCNFVEAIPKACFDHKDGGGNYYCISTQKEIFPILDKCHCMPTEKDAIFDFGCGKGGAMVSFLDYGFRKAGGVEFERKIYEVMLSNFRNLGIDMEKTVSCIYGDAADVKEVLDDYNWFFYFDPFCKEVFEVTICNIGESLKRKPRKIHLILRNPYYHEVVTKSGFFVLTNQFCVATRQKVVDVFVTKKDFER